MRRPSWVIGLVLVALCAAAGSAVAEAPDQLKPPELAASVESCTTSLLPTGRVVTFVGAMPTITGAERMQMRFDLERQRPRDGQWRRVQDAAGFGAWESTDAGRAGFVFHKRVDGLQVPASYRAVVRFRWRDAAGRIVRRARRMTESCAQPDVRPDLVPGALTAIFDARPGLAVYRLVVRNAGSSAAGPFRVRVGGAGTDVAGLGPRQQRTIIVIAPVCLAGTTTLAEVDADHVIDESRERSNEVARRCPLWGG